MRLIDELRAEHDLIDHTLGAFRSWVESSSATPADGALFIEFFRHYAGAFHHDREEHSLFPALHAEAELPLDRGPIAVLTAEHGALGALLDQLEPLAQQRASLGLDQWEQLRQLAQQYTRGLWRHIDAENSVLLPESEARLRRHHVKDLPSRPPTPREVAAMQDAMRLVKLYPAWVDHGLMRGDGCIMCAAYGTSCRGLEREWWNESEWSEVSDRFSGD